MDSTKVIADLCAVIDRMNVIIQAQAMELAQFGALAHEEEIAAVRRQYASCLLYTSTTTWGPKQRNRRRSSCRPPRSAWRTWG